MMMLTQPHRRAPSRVSRRRPFVVREPAFDDLRLGGEQMTSNECWESDLSEFETDRTFEDPRVGAEQVSSNECGGPEDD